MNLSEYKTKYGLRDVPDEILAEKLYQQYGQGMPQDAFYSKLQYKPQAANQPMGEGTQSLGQGLMEGVKAAPEFAWETAKGIGKGIGDIAFFDPSKGETPYELMDLIRDAASGLAKGGRAIGNAPGNAINYLGEKMYGDKENVNIPDFTLSDTINNFDFDKFFGTSNDRTASQLIQGAASFVPAMGAAAGNPFLAAGIHATGEKENPIPGILSIPLLHAATKTPGTIKNPAKAMGEIKNAGQEVFGVAKETADTAGRKLVEGGKFIKEAPGKAKKALTPSYFEENKALGESLEKLTGETKAAKEAAKESQSATARVFGKEFEDLIKGEEEGIEQMQKFAPREEGQAKANLLEKNKEVHNTVEQGFNEAYTDFNEGPGQAEYKNSIDLKTAIDVYKPAIKAFATEGKNAAGLFEKMFNPELKGNKKTASWVDFRRKVRNVKNKYNRLLKSKDIEPGLESKYRDTRDNLADLENNILLDIENSVGKEDFAQLRHIDDQYQKLSVPFQEETALRQGYVKPRGKITSERHFETINKLGAKDLMDLLQKSEGWKELVAKHDLMGKDWSNPKVVSEALQGDAGRALPEYVQKVLSGLEKTQKNKAMIEAANKQIAAGELKAIINEPKMRQILKDRPDLIKRLEETRSREAAAAELEKLLEETGMKKKEAQDKVDKFKKTMAIALTATGVVATGGIIKKLLGAL